MDGISFKVNSREFDSALRQYVMVSRRTIPEIVNNKAFFIARRAVVKTPKADLAAIDKTLDPRLVAHVGYMVTF